MSLPKGTYINTGPLQVGDLVRPSGHYYLIINVRLVMAIDGKVRVCNVLQDKEYNIKFEYQWNMDKLLQLPVAYKDVYE